ncbi:helix-turn-helix domain-containing protein [Ligilactobacillus salivarius]|uniref:Transcriptional regulator n=1 Tax=Ligilactobacillus salivarius TaxID=1624 RepID=A0A1D7TU19_9LACO|nr:helix-turn-helix transcriptional regulator [Ligilactobacillus salivarius]AOO74443.1 transcriptional regulator [Ligilactobacillus salivarius]MBC6925380.1 XRE family transcriptional regulator [Ligilactobacillus salivarius]MBM6956698.1 helix-turn-helix transcriptional regulator [Ligilactobacillus salivarius]MBX0284045.1 helix-turn-helix transcriptional regulator [Ligilactobacillus salivarius]NME23809.1 helix-turn-helix transcriptional regulator [Ligilactobacillus salivarius]
MRISYNPLWKLLIDRGMNKKDLRELSGISTSSIAKLGKGENITTDVLLKICTALNCQISDILETITDEDVENNEVKIHQEDSNG